LGYEEVVPETLEQKMLLAESGIKAGYLTINEARKLRGLDALPNGDVLLVPLNLIPTPVSGKITMPAPATPPKDATPVSPNGEKPGNNEKPKSKSLTPEQKELQWNTFIQKTSRQELAFIKLLETIFNEQKERIINSIETTGQSPDMLDDKATAKRLEPMIELAYRSAFEDDYPIGDVARAWITERALQLAIIINKTTLDAIRTAIQYGITQGESIPQLNKRVEDYFVMAATNRVELISRTEVIADSNKGSLDGYVKEGFPRKEWFSALDERVRETHALAHGQIVGINENFSIGMDSMPAPGQGSVPEENINCRCYVLPVNE
jgi:SPP1 gp7 family putative phage head morphogenesis protein